MGKIDTERSIETELCLNTFSDAFNNGTELVTYRKLSEITKIPGLAASTGCVTSARRILRSQHSIDTEAERGIGIRKLSNSQKANSDSSKKIYRAAKRQGAIYKRVVYEELAEQEKQPFNAKVIIHQAITHVASNKTKQKLLPKVPTSPKRIQLPSMEVMDMVR